MNVVRSASSQFRPSTVCSPPAGTVADDATDEPESQAGVPIATRPALIPVGVDAFRSCPPYAVTRRRPAAADGLADILRRAAR